MTELCPRTKRMNEWTYEWANSPQTWSKGFAIFQKWKSFPAANVIHLNTIAVKIWLLTVTMKNENILEVSFRFDRSWVSMKIWMKRIFCGGFITISLITQGTRVCVESTSRTTRSAIIWCERRYWSHNQDWTLSGQRAFYLFLFVCVVFLNPVQTLLTKNSEYTQLR